MYSQNVYYENKYNAKRRAKGVKKCVIESDLSHEEFVSSLFQNIKKSIVMKTLRSYSHQIYSIESKKVGLSPFDDKVYVLNDGFNTYNYGHYRIEYI